MNGNTDPNGYFLRLTDPTLPAVEGTVLPGTLVKRNNAWLVTWEWSGDHAAMENPFVGIFDGRWGSARVEQIMKAAYFRESAALWEQLRYIRKRSTFPMQIYYGRVASRSERLPEMLPTDEILSLGSTRG